MITLTDAEQRFADSPEGARLIARERRDHSLREGYKGAQALPWTDAMEAAATQRLATQHARDAVKRTVADAANAKALEIAQAARDTQHAMLKERMRTAWCQPLHGGPR
jgi:hypothetical protein